MRWICRGCETTDENQSVAFVDMGHSKTSVAIAEFSSSKLKMLARLSYTVLKSLIMEAITTELER
jgi:hypothetical protein